MTGSLWHYSSLLQDGTHYYLPTDWTFASSRITASLIDPSWAQLPSAGELGRFLLTLPRTAFDADLAIIRTDRTDNAPGGLADIGHAANEVTRITGRTPKWAALGFLSSGRAPQLLPLTADFPNAPDLILDLRALELLAALKRGEAIHSAHRAHFELPSGQHVSRFIRLGDALDDYHTVVRLADWLEQYLSRNTLILADTSTILPLATEIAHRGVLTKTQTRNKALPVFTFPSYPTPLAVRQAFQRISRAAALYESSNLLLIVSVTGSGRLMEACRKLAAEMTPGVRLDAITLVDTTRDQRNDHVFLGAKKIVDQGSATKCGLCKEAKHAGIVYIDAKKYYPRVAVPIKREFVIIGAASAHSDFWDFAEASDAIRVHAYEHTTGQPRHLTVDVHVERMLELPAFFEEAKQRLVRSVEGPPQIVVIPENLSTTHLERMAREAYPGDVIIVRVPRSETPETERSLADQIEPIARRVKRLLVLDEIVVTGATLRAVHRRVQEALSKAIQGPAPETYKIYAFAVLARPETRQEWSYLEDSLYQGPGGAWLRYGWLIPMPSDPCPWCEEKDFLTTTLRRLGPKDSNRSILELRLERLQQIGEGLKEGLYFCNPDGTTAEIEATRLTRNSLFGNQLSEPVAYAAMASAMHHQRLGRAAETEMGAVWGWDLPRIINAYHDPVLQSAFLRSATKKECYWADYEETERALQHALFCSPSPELRQFASLGAEHILAALSGKYPPKLRAAAVEAGLKLLRDWHSPLAEVMPTLVDSELGEPPSIQATQKS